MTPCSSGWALNVAIFDMNLGVDGHEMIVTFCVQKEGLAVWLDDPIGIMFEGRVPTYN